MKKKFPELYKKNSTGKIQFWNVRVRTGVQQYPEIVTTYGVLDGKEQETTEGIFEGKNLGKKNETTELEQAMIEAESRWTKKKKSGYVETYTDAKEGKLDKIIEGGVLPMLAHKFKDHSDKIKFPCIVQPKLDGIRCVAIINGESVTLWSRTRKQITSCPHIEQALRERFHSTRTNIILDGELYNHELKKDFEKIVSAVRKKEPSKESSRVQYHIYDVIEDKNQEARLDFLTLTLKKADKVLKLVENVICPTMESVKSVANHFRKGEGYEGAMIRNMKASYVNKRSTDLLKVKFKDDDEFSIVGIVEGKGKLAGHVGAFTCQTISGETFEVKLSGKTSFLKECFKDHSLWKNKQMTVEFDGYTNARNVPRDPVGLRIRDDL